MTSTVETSFSLPSLPTERQQYLALARGLVEVEATFLAKTQNDTCKRWFRGDENYFNIILEQDPHSDTIGWLQITLRGRGISWSEHSRSLEFFTTEETYAPTHGFPRSRLLLSSCFDREFLLKTLEEILRYRRDDPIFSGILSILINTTDDVHPHSP
jgi:hypothetical protein